MEQGAMERPLLAGLSANAREPTSPGRSDIDKKPPTDGEDPQRCLMASMDLPELGSFDWHPGGQNMLETARRSECPGLLFLSYHMGSDLDGKVVPIARNFGLKLPQRGKMYDEMQKAAREVKRDHPWVRNLFHAYCVVLSVSLLIMFAWWVTSPDYVKSFMLGLIFELFFLNVFHTRHHQGGRLYKNKFLHTVTTPVYDFVDATFGYYPYAWWFNHHVRHHVYTNDDHTDSDIPSMWPLIRSCHNQPRLKLHMLQTFYWPFLVPFTALNFPLLNLFREGGRVLHFVAWVLVMFVIPMGLHGLPGLTCSLLVSGLASCCLAYKFAISHAHNDLRSQVTSKEDYENVDEWMAAQIEESISYGGFWTTVIFGGINMQVEHHLAPALDPPLYYYLAPRIRSIAQKYGCKYTAEATFWHAVWQFHKKLWMMGKE